MEALAAVGLASSILQFISFSTDLLSSSREIYSSLRGSTKQLDELDDVRQFLADIYLALSPRQSPESLQQLNPSERPTKGEIDLVRLSLRCRDTALSLEKEFRFLILHDDGSSKRSKGESLRLAIKLKLGKHVERLQKVLDQQRRELMLCLQVISTKRESAMMKYLEELKDANLKTVYDHREKLDEILELVRTLPTQTGVVLRQARDNGDYAVPLQSIAEALEIILSSSARQWIPEDEIVRSLYFEALPARHGAIQDAHRKTFEWLLKPRKRRRSRKDAELPEATLLNWLQSGSGIYWVSGKPGSGKSTLMKLIAGHPLTQEALDTWAGTLNGDSKDDGGKGCMTAAYYFWSAGTLLQKSVEGLLRALLFEILVQAPELISVALPKRWAALNTATHARSRLLDSTMQKTWNISELTEALRLLSQSPSPAPGQAATKRFCFFIDGLDEFYGDHRELVRILSDVVPPSQKNPTLKLCVSSRPWNVFEDSLGVSAAGQKLYVHELTRGDITAYINETLCEDANWLSEVAAKPAYKHLVNKITEKAQGVFLWVVLVVKSVIDGLSNGDSLAMLERRVDGMPQELGPFFRHILLSIPQEYHRHMAIYFRIALDATSDAVAETAFSHITLTHISFLDDWLDDEDSTSRGPPLQPMDNHDIFRRHRITKRRLNARCQGLLESHLHPPETRPYLAHHILLLHRTVHDFLRTVDMADFLDELTGNTFVELLMLYSCISLFKSLPQSADSATEAELASLEADSEVESTAQLEAVETICEAIDDLLGTASARATGELAKTSNFAPLVVRYGLCGYVAASIESRAAGFTDVPMLLRVALENVTIGNCEAVNMADTITMLLGKLQLQAGPQACVSHELWEHWLQQLMEVAFTKQSIDVANYHRQIHDLILPHVADVNCQYRHSLDKPTVAWGYIFKAFVGDTYEYSQRGTADVRAQMLASLLSRGADPNAPCEEGTAWVYLCHTICNSEGGSKSSERNPARLDFLARSTVMLLKAGADTASHPLPEETVRALFPVHLANQICSALAKQAAAISPAATWSAHLWRVLQDWTRS